ncbi:MAG: hypothetical protein HC886_04775 [Leptolyngbyaceae cyanobacterium SM1_1_3]|nr:hypothetical protein [Leptolyngbyaceae cyanobacterium SM1_1_3]NJN04350.1 hypothetical protein [Leptolyngbyaceae cyanobacterium RM1_1_2]NJO09663.1 hypothetical protein [Leptolyngbyaceae cyanobacterium SL_1_1]
MERSKIVAIITGVLSLLLAVGYLLLVQILDFRGEMLPAPQEDLVGKRSPEPTALPLENKRPDLVGFPFRGYQR